MENLLLCRIEDKANQLHPLVRRLLDDQRIHTYQLIDPDVVKKHLKAYFIKDYYQNSAKYSGLSRGSLDDSGSSHDSDNSSQVENQVRQEAENIWNNNDIEEILSITAEEPFPGVNEQVLIIKELSDLLTEWVRDMPIHMASIALLTFNDRYMELLREKRTIIEDLAVYESKKQEMITSLNNIAEELSTIEADELVAELREQVDDHFFTSISELQGSLLEVNQHLECFSTLETSELICAICKDNPISLITNCGHSYCDQCINNLLPENSEELSQEQLSMAPKECAYCRAEIVQTIKIHLGA